MINKRLSKNFSFVSEDWFEIERKEIVINKLINIEEKLKENSNTDFQEIFSNLAWNIFNVAEIIFEDFLKQEHRTDYDNTNKNEKNLKNFIEILRQYYNLNNSIYSSLTSIISYRDMAYHNEEYKEIRKKLSKNDVIGLLKDLYIVLINFFGIIYPEEKILKEYNFNESVYKNINDFKKEMIRGEEKQKDHHSRNISINKNSIGTWLTFETKKICIPIYQRGYTWKIDNVNILIQDILSRMKDGKTHYLGTVAFKNDIGPGKDSTTVLKIIDGQQRITTSILLMKACEEVVLQANQELHEDYVLPRNLVNLFQNPGAKASEISAFEKILTRANSTNQKGTTTFEKNYQYMVERLRSEFNNSEHKDIRSFIENFISIFKDKFIVGDIEFDYRSYSNRDEMEIFDNLNSKGKSLNWVDLLKNNILNYCHDNLLSNDNTQAEIIRFYNGAVSANKLDENQGSLEEFYQNLYCYLTGIEMEGQDETHIKFNLMKSVLEKRFSKYVEGENIELLSEYKKFINELAQYMFAQKIINEFGPNHNNIFINKLKLSKWFTIWSEKKKRRLFFPLNCLIIDIFSRTKNWKFDFNVHEFNFDQINLENGEKEIINRLYEILTLFIAQTSIAIKQGDSDIKRVVYEMIKKCNGIDDFKELEKKLKMLIKDELTKERWNSLSFKSKIQNNDVSHLLLRVLLLLVENKLSKDNQNGEKLDWEGKISLEHIMPQEIKLWVDENPDLKLETEINPDRFKKNIGNCMILTTSDNSKIKNSVFEIKKEKMYASSRSLLCKNDKNSDLDIVGKTKWDFEYIDSRKEAILKEIKEIFKDIN